MNPQLTYQFSLMRIEDFRRHAAEQRMAAESFFGPDHPWRVGWRVLSVSARACLRARVA